MDNHRCSFELVSSSYFPVARVSVYIDVCFDGHTRREPHAWAPRKTSTFHLTHIYDQKDTGMACLHVIIFSSDIVKFALFPDSFGRQPLKNLVYVVLGPLKWLLNEEFSERISRRRFSSLAPVTESWLIVCQGRNGLNRCVSFTLAKNVFIARSLCCGEAKVLAKRFRFHV